MGASGRKPPLLRAVHPNPRLLLARRLPHLLRRNPSRRNRSRLPLFHPLLRRKLLWPLLDLPHPLRQLRLRLLLGPLQRRLQRRLRPPQLPDPLPPRLRHRWRLLPLLRRLPPAPPLPSLYPCSPGSGTRIPANCSLLRLLPNRRRRFSLPSGPPMLPSWGRPSALPLPVMGPGSRAEEPAAWPTPPNRLPTPPAWRRGPMWTGALGWQLCNAKWSRIGSLARPAPPAAQW